MQEVSRTLNFKLIQTSPLTPTQSCFDLSPKVLRIRSSSSADKSPSKIDLGVGVYRNEQGRYNELGVLKRVKEIISQADLGHDYEVTTGDAEFVKNACKVLLGAESEAVKTGRIASTQAISGTGSIHLAALFLSRAEQFKCKKVYIGTPAWGNYEPLFNLVGFEVVKYRHYDAARGVVAFSDLLKAVEQAPSGSIFVLQGCCHNPSGADLSNEQWRTLARAMKPKDHFPFFDMAYQGLGSPLAEDAFGLRHFAEQRFELLACQSFSKNFGLYGERCDVLHVLAESDAVAANVYDQLRCLIRWEFSSSPAYGSRLVNTILKDTSLTSQWQNELTVMRERLVGLRRTLYDSLTKKQKTPGNWDAILTSTGLFCFLPLPPQQCETLGSKHHIYMLLSGRINVSGMNQSNIERIAKAIDEVVKHAPSSRL
ncbi:hypothetical protein E8E11_002807 [Didymella keratinophila]|nr:hypothetical protein E8E11_002807 [Didymella keratinophila]